MSIEENKALIQRYFEDLSGTDKSPSAVRQYVSDPKLQEHIAVMEAGLPRYTLTAEELIAEGDKVVVRATVHGTHTGELMGLAPTGRPVAFPAMVIYQIADGKIVDHWLNADLLGLLQQLGAAPAPAGVIG